MNEYRPDLLSDLKNLRYCGKYLGAAIADSVEAFLVALRDIADAQKGMTKLASEAGVNRENLYRTLSEQGNPRLRNLKAVLDAIGLKIEFSPIPGPSLSGIAAKDAINRGFANQASFGRTAGRYGALAFPPPIGSSRLVSAVIETDIKRQRSITDLIWQQPAAQQRNTLSLQGR